MTSLEALKAKFTSAKQEHVFRYLDKLSSSEVQTLLHDLSDIDPVELNKIHERTACMYLY
jgi:hypothetical protein